MKDGTNWSIATLNKALTLIHLQRDNEDQQKSYTTMLHLRCFCFRETQVPNKATIQHMEINISR